MVAILSKHKQQCREQCSTLRQGSTSSHGSGHRGGSSWITLLLMPANICVIFLTINTYRNVNTSAVLVQQHATAVVASSSSPAGTATVVAKGGQQPQEQRLLRKEDPSTSKTTHKVVVRRLNERDVTLRNKSLTRRRPQYDLSKSSNLPYYLHGKVQYQSVQPYNTVETHIALKEEIPRVVSLESQQTSSSSSSLSERQLTSRQLTSATVSSTKWVLPAPLRQSLRNHDSVVLEHNGRQTLVNMLGRYNRHVQWMDLLTGQQWSRRTKNVKDPDGRTVDDLNHVKAVLVDSIETDTSKTGASKEVWLTCGFLGDEVNQEVPIGYARIIDMDTMEIRVGPKLPRQGGACVAAALTIIPNEPPQICNFGGTEDSHDSGRFVEDAHCYDRVREKWWKPFGDLPMGIDHGSLAHIPASTCNPNDPDRLIIFNYRTEAYGGQRPEMLVYDLPSNGWTLEQLEQGLKKNQDSDNKDKASSGWYFIKDIKYAEVPQGHVEAELKAPRDAAGMLLVNQGRTILNFGGVSYIKDKTRPRLRFPNKVVRAFDVCTQEWRIHEDLSHKTFAIQTAASSELQLAFTCGGQSDYFYKDENFPFCVVSHFPNMELMNMYGDAATKGFAPDFEPGYRAPPGTVKEMLE